MYELFLTSYNGMQRSFCLGNKESCHTAARKIRARHEKQGGDVTVLSPNSWELEDNGYSIGDNDGILEIVKFRETN
jgi:hypothetical protein